MSLLFEVFKKNIGYITLVLIVHTSLGIFRLDLTRLVAVTEWIKTILRYLYFVITCKIKLLVTLASLVGSKTRPCAATIGASVLLLRTVIDHSLIWAARNSF